MKKSIPFLALLFFFSFACNKGSDSQTTQDQSTNVKTNDAPDKATDRAICCCRLVVSTTYFGGLTICGVTGAGNACSMKTSCGQTCGAELMIIPPDKTADFCFDTDCPICLRNDGVLPIQISLVCIGGTAGPFTIPAMTTLCYQIDCDGTFQLCP